ncbi:metal-dependent hydrolase [Halobium salinum]|uniref:Metal-dependent hydrolase n=1 Tax=Halobium salinum TaxID=1364940 RepID=A0ABD5P9K5_9EURY|nr:metal-dependent hydrolase [Halobium salinum]
MVTTHAGAGLLLALPVALLVPELAPVAGLAAFAGGAFPDLDMLVGQHRRTLHYPALGWVPAVPAGAAAIVAPGPVTVAVALFLLAAALHAVSDAFDGGLADRPWEQESERAVYYHVGDRWLPPRGWVRYDGAPEDFGLSAVLLVPGLFLYGDLVTSLSLGGLVVAAVYTAVRKRLPDVALEFIQ